MNHEVPPSDMEELAKVAEEVTKEVSDKKEDKKNNIKTKKNLIYL